MYKNIYYDFMEGRVTEGIFLAPSLHVEFLHVALCHYSKHSIPFIRNLSETIGVSAHFIQSLNSSPKPQKILQLFMQQIKNLTFWRYKANKILVHLVKLVPSII